MQENNTDEDIFSERKEEKENKEARVITPEMASSIDGVQVREVKVASGTDLSGLVKGRENDNPTGMPSNRNNEMFSFVGKEASVDGAFNVSPVTEDLKGLYL